MTLPWPSMDRSKHRFDRRHFPARPTNRDTVTFPPVDRLDRTIVGRRLLLRSLDLHHLWPAKLDHVLDEPRSGLAQHHRAGRGNGFHSLRHADLLTDCRVTQSPRTDLPDDHLT
jgi:hypothetical protein